MRKSNIFHLEKMKQYFLCTLGIFIDYIVWTRELFDGLLGHQRSWKFLFKPEHSTPKDICLHASQDTPELSATSVAISAWKFPRKVESNSYLSAKLQFNPNSSAPSPAVCCIGSAPVAKLINQPRKWTPALSCVHMVIDISGWIGLTLLFFFYFQQMQF